MTRIKKSRKPGSVVARKPAKPAAVEKQPRVPKKPTGNKPGSRQESAKKKSPSTSNKPASDPRIGSKTPIALGGQATETKSAKKVVKQPAIAAVTKLASANAIDLSELAEIENDSYLQSLVEKREQDLSLTDEELDYLTSKLARYDQLVSNQPSTSNVDEKEEWQSFSHDFDDFFEDDD